MSVLAAKYELCSLKANKVLGRGRRSLDATRKTSDRFVTRLPKSAFGPTALTSPVRRGTALVSQPRVLPLAPP
jgi:hypothetical protein